MPSHGTAFEKQSLARSLVFTKIDSKNNYADMLMKPLPPVLFHRLVEPLLFRRAPTVPPPSEQKRDEPTEPQTLP